MARFPKAAENSPSPASYETHTNKDSTLRKSERPIFGKTSNVNFADARAKLNISPGPVKNAPVIQTWNKIAQSPGRKRVWDKN